MLKNICAITGIMRIALYMKRVNIKLVYSKNNLVFIDFLYKNGYIRGYNIYKKKNKYNINIFLKYYKNKSVIKRIETISKPSKMRYMSFLTIKKTYNFSGLLIVSTNKGKFFFNYKEILLNKVGGLVICFIY